MLKLRRQLNQPNRRNAEIAYRVGLVSGVLIVAIGLVLFTLLHS